MFSKRSSLSDDLAVALVRDRQAALNAIAVSRETIARLDAFVDLLLIWQARINLVAASTLPTLWTRHIADSLQLLDIGHPDGIWIDLGSGGGFPGIVLACALAGTGGHVHLVERNNKKAAFLREAQRVTAAPATIHALDIVDFVDSFSTHADYITARALAPLKVLIELSEPLLTSGTVALFPKGQDVEAELTEATKYWNIQHRLHASKTSSDSFVVEIMGVERRGPGPNRKPEGHHAERFSSNKSSG
jgi:16S rRNA (guanine527-N7)-methyltransferase